MELTNEVTERGVTERDFTVVSGEGEPIPGVLWTPEGATGSRPTVLIGHGGTQHKRVDHVVSLARRLVRHLGYAAVSIDAPEHGDRVRDPEAARAARKALEGRISEGAQSGRTVPTDEKTLERMGRVGRQGVQDWKAVLDSVATVDGVGAGPYGWWGVSMGTIIGLRFVAAEPRISAAVFGLAGVIEHPAHDDFVPAAESITVPVLFLLQRNDELVTVKAGMQLFDALGSKVKTAHINPGGHVQTPAHERDAVEHFYARHLGKPS